jgi:type III restriction/modification enzyme restriction subunit
LLDQWVARLSAFLDIDPNGIGVVRGGKKRPTGVIDVALIQSLVRKGEVSDLVEGYGHLVVDECHHLSAVSFEAIAPCPAIRVRVSSTITGAQKPHAFMLSAIWWICAFGWLRALRGLGLISSIAIGRSGRRIGAIFSLIRRHGGFEAEIRRNAS